MQKDRSYKDEIHRAFRRSESQLRKALKRRKAEVKVRRLVWQVTKKESSDCSPPPVLRRSIHPELISQKRLQFAIPLLSFLLRV